MKELNTETVNDWHFVIKEIAKGNESAFDELFKYFCWYVQVVLDVINAWIPDEDVRYQMLHPVTYEHIIYPIPQSELDVKKEPV